MKTTRTKYWIEKRYVGDFPGIDDSIVAEGFDFNILRNMLDGFMKIHDIFEKEFGKHKNDYNLESESAYRDWSYTLLRQEAGKGREAYYPRTGVWG